MGKVNHTLHKLGAATVVFRPIVAIAHQRREVSKGLAHRVPPLGDAVSQAGAGDFGADSVEQDCIAGRHQATHWGQGRLGLAIVIGGRDLGSTLPPRDNGPTVTVALASSDMRKALGAESAA